MSTLSTSPVAFQTRIRLAANQILADGERHWRQSRMRSVREIGEAIQELIRREGEFKNIDDREHADLVATLRSYSSEPTEREEDDITMWLEEEREKRADEQAYFLDREMREFQHAD